MFQLNCSSNHISFPRYIIVKLGISHVELKETYDNSNTASAWQVVAFLINEYFFLFFIFPPHTPLFSYIVNIFYNFHYKVRL